MPKTTTVRKKSKSIASSAKKPIAAITTTEPSPRATRELRIGLVGYGFMGRAHANAIHQVAHFFNKGTAGNDLRRTVLQAVCGRDEAKLREFGQGGGEGEVAQPRLVQLSILARGDAREKHC